MKIQRNHKLRRQFAKLINHQRSAVLDDEMCYRSAPLGQIDEERRIVPSVISTEQPVAVYDYRNGGMVDEVLVARGGSFPSQVPMLDDHSRWGSSSVIGSGRNVRLDDDKWRAELNFAMKVGDRADQIWELVKQRHLTDVSIGYRYTTNDYVDIPAGKTQEVMGRNWTAGQRTLRVVVKWTGREISTTPIGADDQAKMGRSKNQRGRPENSMLDFSGTSVGESQSTAIEAERMNKLLDFLRKHGLAANVTTQPEMLVFARTLSAELQTEFATLCRSENVDFVPTAPASTTQTRSETTNTPAVVPTAPTQTVDQIRAERERMLYINQQRGNLSDDVVNRAIAENWDTSRINQEFAAARNANPRTPPVSAQAPAGHVVDRSLDLRTLQAAMLMKSGINPDSQFLRRDEVGFSLRDHEAQAGWIAEGVRHLDDRGRFQDEQSARAFDRAYSMRSISLIDVCRCALDLEGVRYDRFDRQEILKRSFSTASLNAIFTTNFAAQMLEGFVGIDDTTMGWTAESELPNFQTVERIQGHKFSRLRKMNRNSQMEDASVQALVESYKLARYAEQFTVDEMDVIDDRFGMLNMAPQDMGEAAGELRPDLVYAILLTNPTMGQDSLALFHTTHANYTSSGAALSSSTLAARKSAMATQTSNGRLCNIRGQYLIVPETKSHVAEVLVGSAERRDTTSSTEYGTKNWAQGKFSVVSEPRLDAGLVDPSDDSSVAGQAGTWFLATARGKYGIEVGYLRDSGKAPIIRRSSLTEGRLGISWSVVMYIGAKAVGYQGLGCSKA